MWVVYEWVDYEGDRDHKYFNEEANARKYYENHPAEFTTVEIEEIETED